MPNLNRLATDDDAIRVDGRGDAAFGERHPLAPSADNLVQHLARFGEEHAVLLVERKYTWFESLQARHQIDDLVLKLLQGFFIDFHITAFCPSKA